MEQKYLPIGSVCTLKGKNKKVMITGYYSVEFNGNLKIKDYSGCAYPEGMLLPEQVITFNHTDIDKIDFVGFRNEEQKVFNNLLDRLTGNNKTEEQKASDFHKRNDMFLTSNNTYSKLLFDENGVVMIADPVKQEKDKNSNTLNNIKFDENGYVLSTNNNSDVSNPFHVEYKNANSNIEESKPSNWNIFKKIDFDENGTVTNVELENNSKKDSMLSEIKFDENGTVISVGKEDLEQKEIQKKYKFDENGVLISIDEVVEDENIFSIEPSFSNTEKTKTNKYEFDENGTVIADIQSNNKANFKFDENGVVVSE